MTFIIIFVVIALTILGLIVLIQGGRDASRDEAIVCPTCRTENRPHAKFCAQCGASLEATP